MDQIKKTKKSQTSHPKPEDLDEEVEDQEEEDEDLEDEEDLDEEEDAKEEKPKKVKQKRKSEVLQEETPKQEKKTPTDAEVEEQRAKEVEILQNDGVFRAELLVRLTNISDHLYILNSLIHKVVGGEEDAKEK